MNRENLIIQIRKKKSFLCVGLDSDISKLPSHLPQTPEGLLEFNRAIIEQTAPYAVAYKINTAFYECLGKEGWRVMEETLGLIPSDIFTIADAKRGDIGNTSAMYAKAFFQTLPFDSITVNPYMGSDSVQPFYGFKDKWVILLALTSNQGSRDFQSLEFPDGEALHQKVLKTSSQWGTASDTMYVVGATKAESLKAIRHIIPDHFLLVPGVGAQGGSLEEVIRYGMNKDVGLLINASRSVIYASAGEDFAARAGEEARSIQADMARLAQW